MSGKSEQQGNPDGTQSVEDDEIDLASLGIVGFGDTDPSAESICFTDEGADLLRMILTEDIAPDGSFVFDYVSAISIMGNDFFSFG